MQVKDFINFANEITNKNIKIYLPENNLKFATYYPYNGELKPCTKYGVSFNNNIIFDFVTGKNVDNFFKSFVTQYINKYEIKQFVFVNGEFRNPTKQECINKFRDNNRVAKHLFYTTIYGIGMFAYFSSENTIEIVKSKIGKYLNDLNITYDTEFSEAGWAFRFLINKSVTEHNKLLTELEY